MEGPGCALVSGILREVLTFDDLIAEDGRVAVRWTSRAVHSGEVFGIAATGRWVTVSGIGIYRLGGGRVIECWGELNLSGLSAAHAPGAGS